MMPNTLDPRTRAATLRSVARRLRKRGIWLVQSPTNGFNIVISGELYALARQFEREARAIARDGRKG